MFVIKMGPNGEVQTRPEQYPDLNELAQVVGACSEIY